MQKVGRRLSTTISLGALWLLLLAGSGALVWGQGKTEKPLYQRLGGYDKIAAVADDFIGRLAADPRFAKFFAGFSVDSKKRLRQHR